MKTYKFQNNLFKNINLFSIRDLPSYTIAFTPILLESVGSNFSRSFFKVSYIRAFSERSRVVQYSSGQEISGLE